jgi:hypothetical protein
VEQERQQQLQMLVSHSPEHLWGIQVLLPLLMVRRP